MIGIQFVLLITYMLNINTDTKCDRDGDIVNSSIVGEYGCNGVISRRCVGIHDNSADASNGNQKGENNAIATNSLKILDNINIWSTIHSDDNMTVPVTICLWF